MPNRNPQIKASERGRKRGGGVAVNQHDIRDFSFKNHFYVVKNIAGNIKECLVFSHNSKIVIWINIEHSENLTEHLSVLSSNANHRIKIVRH